MVLGFESYLMFVSGTLDSSSRQELSSCQDGYVKHNFPHCSTYLNFSLFLFINLGGLFVVRYFS